MYEHVIVAFDGSVPGRAAMAPAGDLAWRCGARMVIVNNTEVSDSASKAAVKSRAMSMSGADVDFWVDTNLDLGDALVEAAKLRTNPIVVMALPHKGGLRRKHVLTHPAERVLRESAAPVLVVGPQSEMSHGLPFVEVVAALDGSAASEAVLHEAVSWADALELRLILLQVVASDAGAGHEVAGEDLRRHATEQAALGIDVTRELLVGADPAQALIAFMRRHDDAVLVMGRHGNRAGKGVIGRTAMAVIAANPRATVLVAS